ncbi:hypothetical protein MLGJGCBP_03001 [Rhodococcus sp. T7]|nr:hypothetical protein MLGJGCBP_03001 [Rhodococcus sp. T7]
MVTGSPGTSWSLILDTTVASVGPYALNMRLPGAHRATSSGGHASPPVTTHSRAVSPAGSTDESAAGVTKQCVTRSVSSTRASSAPP